MLADLLDWHRREDKPAWWRFFYLCRLSSSELIGEPDALGGLTGGEIVDQVKKSVVRRFSFPPQEHKFSAEKTAEAGRYGRWTMRPERIELKVGMAYDGPLPAAVIVASPDLDPGVLPSPASDDPGQRPMPDVGRAQGLSQRLPLLVCRPIRRMRGGRREPLLDRKFMQH